jgi:HD-GYP domain-containing protein (c-di-GMP phosphodiesterase class II)
MLRAAQDTCLRNCRRIREGFPQAVWNFRRVPLLALLTAALEARDPSLRGHSERVTAVAESVAVRLGWRGARLDALRLGGVLHDVGKIAVDAAILRKPGPLDALERAQIRLHPQAGARLIDGIDVLQAARACVLYHHERWDGCGYPEGRAGSRIPAAARILAVADAFDAMTSPRPYRPPLPRHRAALEIELCAGSQFDPRVAHAFLAAWRAGEIL